MTSFDWSPIGRVDFPNNSDGWWEFSLSRADGSIRVDFNVDGNEMTQPGFDLVRPCRWYLDGQLMFHP